jgi:hypothetical protein
LAWTDPVDLYCERLGPGFWAEPVNAFSNAGFILVGLLFLVKARREGADGLIQAMCLWVVAIGVGSFLFHTFANRWSALADVVPIWSFVVAYVIFALRRFLAMPWWRVARGLLLVGAVVAIAVWLTPTGAAEWTNGSIQYLPALVALVVFIAALAWAGSPAWRAVAAAGAVFVLSLFLRSIDLQVCDAFPWGTHWAWHLLNAAMLALLLSAAVRYGRSGLYS